MMMMMKLGSKGYLVLAHSLFPFRRRIRPKNAGIWPEKPKGKTERKRERKQKSNRYFIQEFEIQNKIKFYIYV